MKASAATGRGQDMEGDMEQDGKYCGAAGAAFYQINIHWTQRPERTQIFPEKGVRVVVLECKEDELGNVSFDGCVSLTHTNEATMAKMIDRLYRIYPGLKGKVTALEDVQTFRVPGTLANN